MADFSEALLALKAGKPVRRTIWGGNGPLSTGWTELIYVRVSREQPTFPLIISTHTGGPVLFACSQWDLLADDWEIADG